jgi:hypothetical protein
MRRDLMELAFLAFRGNAGEQGWRQSWLESRRDQIRDQVLGTEGQWVFGRVMPRDAMINWTASCI